MRRERVWLLALLVLAGGAGLWLLRETGPQADWLPGCLFHRVSGLHCPGCGMTRAAHAALHGEWVAAFRYNVLGVFLLPLALLGAGLELAAWSRGGRPLVKRTVWPGLARVLLALVLAFWVLRNLPWWPFELLAPQG